MAALLWQQVECNWHSFSHICFILGPLPWHGVRACFTLCAHVQNQIFFTQVHTVWSRLSLYVVTCPSPEGYASVVKWANQGNAHFFILLQKDGQAETKSIDSVAAQEDTTHTVGLATLTLVHIGAFWPATNQLFKQNDCTCSVPTEIRSVILHWALKKDSYVHVLEFWAFKEMLMHKYNYMNHHSNQILTYFVTYPWAVNSADLCMST